MTYWILHPCRTENPMKSPLSVCLLVGQSFRLSLCPSVSLSVCLSVPQFGVFLGNVSLVFLGMAPQITQNKKFAYLYNISPKACFFFCLQIKGKAFYKLKVYFWVCMCVCVHVCVCVYVHSSWRLYLSESVGIPGNKLTMLCWRR